MNTATQSEFGVQSRREGAQRSMEWPHVLGLFLATAWIYAELLSMLLKVRERGDGGPADGDVGPADRLASAGKEAR